MYYLFVSNNRGGWIEHHKDERFSEVMNVAKAIGTETMLRVTGPEGKWTRARDSESFIFTPNPAGLRKPRPA